MNKRLALGSMLTAQLVLALGLMWQGHARTMDNEAQPWLNFPSSDVSRIVVADSSNTTTLELKEGQWSLVDPALPADSSRINTLLTTLDGLKTTWPVVSTAAGRERFEVTEDKHQRQLSLFKDDSLLGEYYFGTSPGFRQTHARRADDDEVYALAFNNFDLPADSNDWLDKALLSAEAPVAIKGADFALRKNGSSWQLDTGGMNAVATPQAATEETTARAAEAAASEPATAETSPGAPVLNADAAGKLADALTNLRVMRVADDVSMEDPVTLEVRSGDSTLTYLFSKAGTTCYVQRTDIAHTFTLSESDYKAIAEQNLAALTATPAAAAADTGAAVPAAATATVGQVAPATTSEVQ